MSKVLNAITKAVTIVGDKPIEVKPSFDNQVYVFVRQVMIAGGSGLVANGTLTNDQLQQLVGGIMALCAVLYGQYKARRDKAQHIVMAQAVSDSVATLK